MSKIIKNITPVREKLSKELGHFWFVRQSQEAAGRLDSAKKFYRNSGEHCHRSPYDWGHKTSSFPVEISLTVLGLSVTLFACFMLGRDLATLIGASLAANHIYNAVTQITFTAIFTFLIYGNILYQLTRIGYFVRLKRHTPANNWQLTRIYEQAAPSSIAMLIPSYKEEISVIRQSLLSCALQDYPSRRVVLCLDDPYNPEGAKDKAALEEARKLPEAVENVLRPIRDYTKSAVTAFRSRLQTGALDTSKEISKLELVYSNIADWFDAQARLESKKTHTDRLFVQMTFIERAAFERGRVRELALEMLHESDESIISWLKREYNRIAKLFVVPITSFERKKFANLSHEPNKAMNINSYISIMGGQYKEAQAGEERILQSCSPEEATLIVPDADFLLTLDADSLLAPDYATRLLHVMQQEHHTKMAVIQTPYSSVPGTANPLEKIAGATTDIQYLIHQGFTAFKATFWVGANAVLRKAALEDIATYSTERGYRIKRYIQDRTVIEDTESSVDLVERGWYLHNYPERLSYSATPPDFGSLLIQRRRWANGGLIILPKLMAYLFSRRSSLRLLGEAFMRIHYLSSILFVNLGVLIIIMYPFERNLQIAWLPLTVVPYYALYARDMMKIGYKLRDFFSVYALNLILIPVNLGGAFKSIEQMITKKQIPFSRTPKIDGITLAPGLYVALELGLLVYCFIAMTLDVAAGRLMHGFYVGANGLILVYAVHRFLSFKVIGDQFKTWISALPHLRIISTKSVSRA